MRIPHFLRVTQTLALVSGFTAPALAVGSCGGEVEPPADAASPYSGDASGIYDGGPMGKVRPDAPYDGFIIGVSPHD